MPDREKVITAIDICLGHGACNNCEYRIKGSYSTMDCRKPMMRDALTLLKEKEEISIYEDKINKCKCGETICRQWHPKFCGFCGRKLLWY